MSGIFADGCRVRCCRASGTDPSRAFAEQARLWLRHDRPHAICVFVTTPTTRSIAIARRSVALLGVRMIRHVPGYFVRCFPEMSRFFRFSFCRSPDNVIEHI
jgi:hypothetical protein